MVMLKSYFFSEESLLMFLRGLYGIPGIKPNLSACKANALPAVLFLPVYVLGSHLLPGIELGLAIYKTKFLNPIISL